MVERATRQAELSSTTAGATAEPAWGAESAMGLMKLVVLAATEIDDGDVGSAEPQAARGPPTRGSALIPTFPFPAPVVGFAGARLSDVRPWLRSTVRLM